MAANKFEKNAEDPFTSLNPHEFIVLTTYRKDGTAVPTTVWFAYEQGKLYVTTQKSAGKMKRIRNNAHVHVTPSDRVGNLLAEPQVQGLAHELAADEYNTANAALKQKYAEQYDRIAGAPNPNRTYIVIEPAPAS
jgi:uncharacterized protein